MQEGYDVQINDTREKHDLVFDKVTDDYWGDAEWSEGHVAEGQKIRLRDYQVDIVNKFIEHPQCLQEVATGAGKTIITATYEFTCRKIWS